MTILLKILSEFIYETRKHGNTETRKLGNSQNRLQKLSKYTCLVILLVLIIGCSDDDAFTSLQTAEGPIQELQTDLYAGGTQIANPYTVTNMRRAMDTIKAKLERGTYTSKPTTPQRTNRSIADEVDIQTTHFYVKFTPQDEDDLGLIKQDSTILVTDYPLDVEFSESWHENRPDLPEGQMPEYFASVPVSRSIPNAPYQVLGNLYIPEDEPYFNPLDEQPITRQSEINTEEDLLHHLLYEAYVNVGREQELLEDNGSFEDPDGGNRFLIFGRRWTPSGRLQIWDGAVGNTPGADICVETHTVDYSGCYDNDGTYLDCPEYIIGEECSPGPGTPGSMIPLRGAQVLMRQLFTVRQAITNADGTFTTGTVRGKARYIVQWERYHYSIRRGLVFQAEMRGPKVKFTPWHKNISGPGGRDHYHGNTHLGALNYYYGNRLGTISPPRNSFFNNQMKIAALGNDGQSLHFPYGNIITGGILTTIYFQNEDASAENIFGTITHELAHAAHKELDLLSYTEMVWQGYILNGVANNPQAVAQRRARRLLETWATTVEVALTVDRYQNELGVVGYEYLDPDRNDPGNRGNYQKQTIAEEPFYTSGGWDMIDNSNQRDDGAAFPQDNVNGYTLSQLEVALVGEQTWIQWRSSIIDLYDNNTEGNLVELFNNWQD